MKSFIVAEIASNWEGNFTKAEKLMQKSKNAGANAVKFQIWRAHDLYNNKHPDWKFIKKSEITLEKAIKLKKIADKIGIELGLIDDLASVNEIARDIIGTEYIINFTTRENYFDRFAKQVGTSIFQYINQPVIGE